MREMKGKIYVTILFHFKFSQTIILVLWLYVFLNIIYALMEGIY